MSQKIKQDIHIGGNISKSRKNVGLTQEEVIAQLQLRGFSLSRSAYSQIETGTYNIRVSELIALTQIFKVDFNTIFKNLTNV